MKPYRTRSGALTAALAAAILIGLGWVAYAADDVIEIAPEVKFVAKFVHGGEYRNSTPKPFVLAQVHNNGSKGAQLYIHSELPDAFQEITINLYSDSVADLLKAGMSYRIPNRHSGPDSVNDPKPPTAMVEYKGKGIECSAIAGTVKVTAIGAVDAPVVATIDGLKWQPGYPACQKFGTKGTIHVQRSIDWQM